MPEIKLPPIAERFMSKKLKTLYKAGFIGGDNELTDLGREHLEAIAIDKFIDDLVGAAETVLDEKKKNKKKDKE